MGCEGLNFATDHWEDYASANGQVPDDPDWFDWILSLTTVFDPEASDGIVESDRQWLYQGGDGSTADFDGGNSVPAPNSTADYVTSDRITTPNVSGHVSQLDYLPGVTTYQTNDFNQVARGIDEGDYPFFAAEVDVDKWYAGLPNLRADIVPASSTYTGSATNTLDGDWFKVTLTEPASELTVIVDVADGESFVTRLDIYGITPSNMYDNAGEGTVHVVQNVSDNEEFSLKITSCSLVGGNTIYFRVTNSIHNLAQPETAWRHPYKFKVETKPVLFTGGNCPESPDCDYTFSAYGASGCDEDCTDRYDGGYGNIRIPIAARRLGTQVTTTTSNLQATVDKLNTWLKNATALNWEFYLSETTTVSDSQYDNWGDFDGTPPANAETFINTTAAQNPGVLNLFIVDDLSGGFAGAPLGNPVPALTGSNWLVIGDNQIDNNYWPVLGHEIAHVFGLFHTFTCEAFPAYSNCDGPCTEGDGISDTPFEPGPFVPGGGSANLMDYDEVFSATDFTPGIDLTVCQAAKMNDLLFNCRNNLGLALETPELFDKATDLLAPQIFNAFYNDPLDELYVDLQGNHYSNDEGYAHWTFTKPNGSIFELWADTLDLNTLYVQGKIDRPGDYGVAVRDRRTYNESEQSEPNAFLLQLGACNFNTICEPWETTVNCSDCQFGNNNFVLNRAEYFLDTDPGYGQATPIAGATGNNIDLNFNVDLTGVNPGVHTLYVRARDDQGNWSFTQRRLFYVYDAPGGDAATLTRLEYFLDDDPGYGQATGLPLADPSDSQDDYNISLSGVSSGIHTLYVRAQNTAGRWSFVQRRLFYVFDAPGNASNELAYLEYFLDDDPGYNQGTSLSLADVSDSQADYNIDLSTITPGIHTLYVRAQNTAGRWSFVQRRLFYVFDAPGNASNELAYLEYFLDDDPGYSQGTSLPLADVNDSQADYNIDLSTITPGIHTLYVRARDTRGRWSFVQRRLFYVYDAPGGPREIVEVEYFVDGPGPEYGQATQLPITPDDDVSIDFTVPTTGLTGNHILYVRAKDNYGRWSFTVSDTLVWSENAITVLSPNGGQVYTAGIDAISGINWDTTNNVGNVDIWLIKPNGLHIAQIATNVDQGGPLPGSWDIPVWVNAGQYRIKVNARNEPTVLGYSTNTFTINSPNGTFCDGFTDLVAASPERDAATCLCEKGMVTPKYYNSFNTYGVNAAGLLERADLAKLTYLLVHGAAYQSPAADFAVPYADLQIDDADYFIYVRDLLYLQYGDDITPYDRDLINFRPFGTIEGRYALKVMLEALDIAPDNSGPSPYGNIAPGDDAYGYVKEAADRGWLPAGFDPLAPLVRGQAFVILKLIIDGEGLDCTAASSAQLGVVTLADYAIPGNFTPMNQGRTVDMAEGYFPSFFKSSFQFPGIGIPLTYGHGYYGHHAEQPERFRPLTPLGRAWSHSFNVYIIEEEGWSTTQLNFADKVYVNWGNGSLHCYDKATRAPESFGVYSTLIRQGEERYVIRSKAQIEYGFDRFPLDTDTSRYVWMLTDITDRNGNEIVVTIDNTGARPRVQSVLGSGEYRLNFSYDVNEKLSAVTDVNGSRVITYVVDGDNNLASYTNAKGDVTTFGYGASPADHLLYSVQLPEGNGITNTYGANNRLETSKINGQTAATQVAAVYDYTQTVTPLVSTVTDTDGNTTTKSYNENGYLSQYDQGGDDLTVVYDANNPALPSSVTSNGISVGNTYDPKGNPLTITLPLGVTHRYTYNGRNDPLTYTNPRSKVTRFTYDGNGNLDDVTDPNNYVTDLQFNPAGQLLWIKSPSNVRFDNTYNTDGSLAGTSGPEGLYQNFDYDNIGRRNFAENANGQVTTFDHDVLDQMIRMTRESDDGDIVTNYRFTPNMLLDSIINAHGDATTFDYNDQNQPTKIQFGDDADLMAYDEEGKLDNTTVPTGDVLDRIYDDRDRPTFNGYATISYDDRDNPLTFTHAGRITTITYDDLDRPSTATYDGKTIGYGYDLNGNTTSCTYSDGTVITKVYDNADRLSQVKLGSTVLVACTYRSDNLPDRVTYGNGTYCDHTYDDASRLISKSWKKSNGTVIASWDIELDGVGNHVSVTAVEPFSAPALAPKMFSAGYNTENEPETVDGQTFTFNALGAQTGDGERTYNWNEHEQLLSVGNYLTYVYDGQKLRRIRVAPEGTWTYDWDVRGMGNILTDYLDGTARYHYVYGAGMICRIEVATGNVSYFHGDVRGSVVAITDATQNITHQYQYGPFGEVLRELEADFNPFGYVGQYGLMQEGEDLYYVRARYMDARQGRFISEDPVWSDNLFPYAGNNPLSFIDHTGNNRVSAEDKALFEKMLKGLGFGLATAPSDITQGAIVNTAITETGYVVSSAFGVNAGAAFIVYGKFAFKVLSNGVTVVSTVYDAFLNPEYRSSAGESDLHINFTKLLRGKINDIDKRLKRLHEAHYRLPLNEVWKRDKMYEIMTELLEKKRYYIDFYERNIKKN